MSEWSQCPSCHLRFRTRASGTCPRCATVLDAPNPDVFDEVEFARRQAVRAATEQREAQASDASLAVLLAGGLLALNGLLQLSVSALESSAEGAGSFLDPWLASFDLVVGGILLSGQMQVKSWATVRAALGGVGLAAAHLLLGGSPAGLMGIVFGIGVLLLLSGKPEAPRLVAGTAVAALAVLVTSMAGAPFLGARNPLGSLSARMNREVAWSPVSSVEGERVGYRLALPDSRWHVVNEDTKADEEAEEESGDEKDRILQEVSPTVRLADANLDVQVMGIKLPPQARIDHGRAMDGLEDKMRDAMPELMVVEDGMVSAAGGDLKVLEGTAWLDGKRTSVALGFGIRGQCVVVVSGSAPPRIYPKVRDDLMAVFASLETTEC